MSVIGRFWMHLKRWLTAFILVAGLALPAGAFPSAATCAAAVAGSTTQTGSIITPAVNSLIQPDSDFSNSGIQFADWTTLSKPPVSALTSANVYDIAADGLTLFLYSNGNDRMYKSTDAGLNWSSSGLDDLADLDIITQLVVSPVNANIILLTDGNDVYLSQNGAVSFEIYDPPALYSPVFSIDISATSNGYPAVLVGYSGGVALALNHVWYDTNYDSETNDTAEDLGRTSWESLGMVDPLAVGFSPSFSIDNTFLTVLKDYEYSEILVAPYTYVSSSTAEWGRTLAFSYCSVLNNTGNLISDPGYDMASIAFPSNFSQTSATYAKAFISLADSTISAPGTVYRFNGKVRSSSSTRSTLTDLQCAADAVSSLDYKGTLASGTLAAGCLDAATVYTISNISTVTSGFSWTASSQNPRSDLNYGIYPNTLLKFSPVSTKLYAGTDGAPGSAFCSSTDYRRFTCLALISVSGLEEVIMPPGGYHGLGQATQWLELLDQGSGQQLLFKSTDSGSTWRLVFDSAPLNNPFVLYLSPNYSTDQTVYLTQSGQDYFMKSTDAGSAWTQIAFVNGMTPTAFCPIDGSNYRLADHSGYRASSSGSTVYLDGATPLAIFSLSGCLLVWQDSGEWWYSLDNGVTFHATGADTAIGLSWVYTFGYADGRWTVYVVDAEGSLRAYTIAESEEWEHVVPVMDFPEEMQGNISALARTGSGNLWYFAADAWIDANLDGVADSDEIRLDPSGNPIAQIWRTPDLAYFEALPGTQFTNHNSLIDMTGTGAALVAQTVSANQVNLFAGVDGTVSGEEYANRWLTFSDTNFGDPVITTAALSAGTLGLPYQQSLSVSGGGYSYRWSVISGELPDGLTLDPLTGVLSGTPAAVGVFSFTAQVASGAGNGTRGFSLSIDPALTITTADLAIGRLGESYTQTLTAAYGTGNYMWSIISGGLPAGLKLGEESGLISGTPQAAGWFYLGVQVEDGIETSTRLLWLRVLASGAPLAWGQNYFGQVGEAGYNDQNTPWVSGLSEAAAVAGGGAHSLAVKPDGTVWTWGYNSHGQLGDGTAVEKNAPVQVSGLSAVVAVAGGGEHSLALKSDGTLWAWGHNQSGQLGDGSGIDSSTPVQVQDLTDVISVAGGGSHSLALKSDGTVWAWGDNEYGQLGTGNNDRYDIAVLVNGLTGIVSIAGGADFSLASGLDGTVWAWGHNQSGQLGDGTDEDHNDPVQVDGLNDIVAVSTGSEHSLALSSDGTLWAWGANGCGQLGDGSIINSAVPVQVDGLTGVAALAAGSEHSLALKSDGTLWAWGAGYSGQLGDAANQNAGRPVQVFGLTAVKAIAGGGWHSLAIDSQFRIDQCLPAAEQGVDYYGSLFAVNGSEPYSWSWLDGVLPAGLTGSTAGVYSGIPSVSGTFPLFIQVMDDSGRLQSAVVTLIVYPPLQIETAALTDAAEGEYYSHSLAASGGSGRYRWAVIDGRLPAGLRIDAGWIYGLPAESGSFDLIIEARDGLVTLTRALTLVVNAALEVSAGALPVGATGSAYSSTLEASGGDGSGYFWSIVSGCLPDGLALDVLTGSLTGLPVASGTFDFTVQVTSGPQSSAGDFTITITPALLITTSCLADAYTARDYNQNLTARCGSGDYRWTVVSGIMPDGLALDPESGLISGTPRTAGIYRLGFRVDDGAGTFTSLFTLKVVSPGAVMTWGSNLYGQLGDGTLENKRAPQANGLSGLIAVAGGGEHSLALKSDGTVWAWGCNQSGQLGDGTLQNSATPAPVSGLTGVSAVAAGSDHSLALRSDGTVWAWGSNEYGQLGDGSDINRNTPLQVNGLISVIAVAAGGKHSLALRSDGTVWTWGSNEYGQLGDGSDINRSTPLQVNGLTGVSAAAAGGEHNLALKSDGTIWAWGNNECGQLGNGTRLDQYWPGPVSGMTGVIALAAGSRHSLALKTDGTLWSWGDNQFGQTGRGAGLNPAIPWQVEGLTGVVAAAGGGQHSLALMLDGTVLAWGSNEYGQLGDGTNNDSATAVPVTELAAVTALSSGGYHNLTLGAIPVLPTTTTLTASLALSDYGQAVTFSTAVSAQSAEGNKPSGIVTFRDGDVVLGQVVLDASGQAACTTAALSVGSHNISAGYGGDSVYCGSSSEILIHDVNPLSIDIRVTLQGSSRPAAGWIVPLTVKFFTPGADVMSADPVYTFDLTTANEAGMACARLTGLWPGIYDISVVSPGCLTGVKRGVEIAALTTGVAMGVLFTGDANDDNKINILDFGLLAAAYGQAFGSAGFDERVDFDRNGKINIADFGLLAANYGRESPVTLVN